MITNLKDLLRRILALLLLSVFTAATVVHWKSPAGNSGFRGGPVRTVSAGAGREPEVPALNSHEKRGFKIDVHPGGKSRAARPLLRSDCERLVMSMVSELNEGINLPADVGFCFEDCSFPDVYYDDETHGINICYQWIDDMDLILSYGRPAKFKSHEIVESLMLGVLLHETAHALIHILKVPVTGREEDDADQFSTLMLLNQRDGARKALLVARVFKMFSRTSRLEPADYWDEHSLDAQRYYDMLCMIYGRDPKGNESLVNNKSLPADRASFCVDDYQRIERSWRTLLKPYAKDSLWQVR